MRNCKEGSEIGADEKEIMIEDKGASGYNTYGAPFNRSQSGENLMSTRGLRIVLFMILDTMIVAFAGIVSLVA